MNSRGQPVLWHNLGVGNGCNLIAGIILYGIPTRQPGYLTQQISQFIGANT